MQECNWFLGKLESTFIIFSHEIGGGAAVHSSSVISPHLQLTTINMVCWSAQKPEENAAFSFNLEMQSICGSANLQRPRTTSHDV